MHSAFPRLACLLSLLCALFSAHAAPLAATDARNVRAVVQSQLKALAADDAAKAFSFAAPGIRERFGSAEQFLSMVKAQYPMVHRPSSVAFLKPEADGETAIQRVQVTDAAGAPWMATYLLHRQKGGAWRISACVVVPDGNRVSA